MIAPGAAQLRAQFRSFGCSAFRLETLQAYAGSEEDLARFAFERGDPAPPPDPHQEQWLAMLRANRESGRTQQRVHVVTEPLSDYLTFELTWEYGPHAAAGEDIRIIAVVDAWPEGVPTRDFWLFDSRELFELDYDAAGNWLGVTHVTNPAAVAQACLTRDAALRHAVPWARYIAGHPELVCRLPQGARP